MKFSRFCTKSFSVTSFSLALLACTAAFAGPIQRVPNTTLAMPAIPPTFGYSVTNAFGPLNFIDPVCLATPPGETNRLFVVERGGNIAVITNLASPDRTVFLSIPTKVGTEEECGLLGLVFHPGYATNGYFFIWYTGTDSTTAGSGRHDILARYQVSATNPNFTDPLTEVKFIRQYDEANNHNAGDMHFGPDGYLYLSLGDEGGANSQYGNDQRIDKDFFSGMIRIDVDMKPGNLQPTPHAALTSINYLIPTDNPFIGATTLNGTNINTATLRTEYWAIGMRNPWRWSFDPPTGLLYLGDVGQDAQEEVDIVVKGGNYGWAYREGSIAGPKSVPVGATNVSIPPILSYAHGFGTNQGYAVMGGLVYRGAQLSQLYGAYVFGDNVSGNIWSLKYDGTNVSNWQLLAKNVGVSSFGTDPRNGDIIFAARGPESSGTNTQPLQRLVYSTVITGSPLPATLAATGAFTNLTTLTPNSGIVAYDINVPFWSDNAIKSRWISIPNTNLLIGFNANSNWSFPTSTVWIKHFDLQTNSTPPMTTRVETRLLVRNSNGVYGVTYRWGGSTTNATLVADGGMDETFVINNNGVLTNQVWHYPGRSECLACHTATAGFGLGFNTAQLNRDIAYTNVTTNQIKAFSDAGYFNTNVTNLHLLPALAAATNTAVSLEYRVRSYLAANCVQCHQPGGSALALWDARISTPGPQCGIINGALQNNLGDANNRVIVPGSLSNSVLYNRVANLGTTHMPPLATSVINTQAVQLLSAWITSDLPSYQTYNSWAAAHFGTNTLNTNLMGDFDGDRALNYLEYLTGTDPVNPNSFWTISIAGSGASNTITFPQIANRGFEVQRNTSLFNSNGWTPLDLPGNEPFFSSTNRTGSVSDTASPDSRYYRVRVFQP